MRCIRRTPEAVGQRGARWLARRHAGSLLLAASLSGCSLMDFDGLATPSGGSAGVSGLGLDSNHGGGDSSGSDAGVADAGDEPAGPINEIANPGFEEGTSGWSSVGSCNLSLSSETPHTGNSCLLVSNRVMATWEGPGYDLRNVLERNTSYRVTIWARTLAPADSPYLVQLTYKHLCADETGEAAYTSIGSNRVGSDWTQLSATIAVPDCALTESLVYLEGPPLGEDFYVDDASIVAETF